MNQDYLFFSQTHFYVMHFPRFSCDTLSRDVYHQRLDPTRQKLLCSEHCSKITVHSTFHALSSESICCCNGKLFCMPSLLQFDQFPTVKPIFSEHIIPLHPYSIQMEGGKKEKKIIVSIHAIIAIIKSFQFTSL